MNTLSQTDFPAREAAAFAADRRLNPVWNDPDLRALLVCNQELFYWQMEKHKLGNLLIGQYLVNTPFHTFVEQHLLPQWAPLASSPAYWRHMLQTAQRVVPFSGLSAFEGYAHGGPKSWEPLPVNGFVREMEEPGWQYEIVQLNTARALQEESLSMRHCVATYVERCAKGYCSIWSLRKANSGAGQFDRLITIEVNKQGNVVQARGFANRMPDCAEAGLIRAWCAEAGLRVHGT
ncbi:MAG: PcfJ domain-containing protein [Saprospirales bacterium]|nr:PcfJ domain-containing protein [Saprospirales bacterium]MBK8920527.1 PcfJ domain-containing protein [Saprospirales bacterium]